MTHMYYTMRFPLFGQSETRFGKSPDKWIKGGPMKYERIRVIKHVIPYLKSIFLY